MSVDVRDRSPGKHPPTIRNPLISGVPGLLLVLGRTNGLIQSGVSSCLGLPDESCRDPDQTWTSMDPEPLLYSYIQRSLDPFGVLLLLSHLFLVPLSALPEISLEICS